MIKKNNYTKGSALNFILQTHVNKCQMRYYMQDDMLQNSWYIVGTLYTVMFHLY